MKLKLHATKTTGTRLIKTYALDTERLADGLYLDTPHDEHETSLTITSDGVLLIFVSVDDSDRRESLRGHSFALLRQKSGIVAQAIGLDGRPIGGFYDVKRRKEPKKSLVQRVLGKVFR